MTTVVNRDLFIYNLTIYLLNTAGELKKADKKTQKKWISEIRRTFRSEYLNPAFTKLYPAKTDTNLVSVDIVWDDIRKLDTLKAIQILSDIDEIFYPSKEDFQEKALVYLMNTFILQTPIKFKVFPN